MRATTILAIAVTILLIVEQIWIGFVVDDYVEYTKDFGSWTYRKFLKEPVILLLEVLWIKKPCPDHYLIHVNHLNKTKVELRSDYYLDRCGYTPIGYVIHHYNGTGAAVEIEPVYNLSWSLWD